MKQFYYNERVYSDLNSLYKENRKDNLVTLEEFKENIEDNMSIDDALSHRRDYTYNEVHKHNLESVLNSRKKYSFIDIFGYIWTFILIFGSIFSFFIDSIDPIITISMILNSFLMVLILLSSLKISTTSSKVYRKNIEEIEPIIAQEHKEIEAKIQEELKII